MKKVLPYFLAVAALVPHCVSAQEAMPAASAPAVSISVSSAPPPNENRYDIVGKMLAPFINVLLTNVSGPNHAMLMTLSFEEVSGRLPKQFKGATLSAAVEFPDKVKLVAPILGEQATIIRNGDTVLAMPGAKIQYLLKQFKVAFDNSGDKKILKSPTPLGLPITAQQAVFLPALFVLEDEGVQDLHGEQCRVLKAGLMPELAKGVKAEDFGARIWVAAGYLPRQVEVKRKDFTAVVAIKDLRFGPALSKSTWEPPAGVTDIYRTNMSQLDAILYVVMNSLKMKQSDAPWLLAK